MLNIFLLQNDAKNPKYQFLFHKSSKRKKILAYFLLKSCISGTHTLILTFKIDAFFVNVSYLSSWETSRGYKICKLSHLFGRFKCTSGRVSNVMSLCDCRFESCHWITFDPFSQRTMSEKNKRNGAGLSLRTRDFLSKLVSH